MSVIESPKNTTRFSPAARRFQLGVRGPIPFQLAEVVHVDACLPFRQVSSSPSARVSAAGDRLLGVRAGGEREHDRQPHRDVANDLAHHGSSSYGAPPCSAAAPRSAGVGTTAGAAAAAVRQRPAAGVRRTDASSVFFALARVRDLGAVDHPALDRPQRLLGHVVNDVAAHPARLGAQPAQADDLALVEVAVDLHHRRCRPSPASGRPLDICSAHPGGRRG